jgi:hypothetical protein
MGEGIMGGGGEGGDKFFQSDQLPTMNRYQLRSLFGMRGTPHPVVYI